MKEPLPSDERLVQVQYVLEILGVAIRANERELVSQPQERTSFGHDI